MEPEQEHAQHIPRDAQTASLGTTFGELGQTGRIFLLEQQQTV